MKSLISGQKSTGPWSTEHPTVRGPLCFALYAKLFLYSPLGNNKPLGAIGKSITLRPSQVPLSENMKAQRVRRKRGDRIQHRKIEDREKAKRGIHTIFPFHLPDVGGWQLFDLWVLSCGGIRGFLQLILAEVFINVEVVCGQLERKGKAAVP